MWLQLRWGLLALFVCLISPCLLCAQSPECVDQSSAVWRQSKKIKINIVGVEFRGENSLSDAARTKLAETIQRSEIEVSPEEPDTYWANVLSAQTISKSLHAQGYFSASTEMTPYLVKAEPDERSYIVSFTIENGPQYRVRTVQVLNATVFEPVELRKQIPLESGEIHNPDKIWDGIKSIARLYISKGYIDTTAGVNFSVDHSERLVDVFVDVREGKQYRVGTVQILGLSPRAENVLKSILEPGQIFDSQSLTDFLKEERGLLLPVDASDNDITVGRNLDDGTLEIVLDFRRCPGDKIPFPPVYVSAPIWGIFQLMALSDRWFQVSY